MIPEFGPILYLFFMIIEAVVFMAFFILFVFWVMPPISRRFIAMKWRKGSPAFIQVGGRVKVYSSDEELPEGVVHNAQGWFLKSVQPYNSEEKPLPTLEEIKLMLNANPEEKRTPEELEDSAKNYLTYLEKQQEKNKSKHSPEKREEALTKVLRAPILDGLDKQVFFGSADSSLVSNLDTLADFTPQKKKGKNEPEKIGEVKHSVLSVLKEIIPKTIGRTQLDALGTLMYLRGLKAAKAETMKLVIIIACLIALVATVGIVVWAIMG